MQPKVETWPLDRARFASAWRAVGANRDNASAWLAGRYAEEHRAYHDAEHITACLAWFDRVRDLAEGPAEQTFGTRWDTSPSWRQAGRPT